MPTAHLAVGNHKIIVINKARRIENIGLSAKVIIDAKKDIQLFISGSSAPKIADSRRNIEFVPKAFNEYQYWIERDRKVVLRTGDLTSGILYSPFEGIGKPEA